MLGSGIFTDALSHKKAKNSSLSRGTSPPNRCPYPVAHIPIPPTWTRPPKKPSHPWVGRFTLCGTHQHFFGAVVESTLAAVTPLFCIVLAARWCCSSCVRRVASQPAHQLERRATDEIQNFGCSRLVLIVSQVVCAAALRRVMLNVRQINLKTNKKESLGYKYEILFHFTCYGFINLLSTLI